MFRIHQCVEHFTAAETWARINSSPSSQGTVELRVALGQVLLFLGLTSAVSCSAAHEISSLDTAAFTFTKQR